MVQWHFNFGHLNDFDGLVSKCLNSVPQYRQMYPAPRAEVSLSLEQMLNEEFPPNQNIMWHKLTHGQKRYYFMRKPNGDDEMRVKVGSGVFGKADRDLRILTSTNECRKIARQFLVRWDKNGSLPGWKVMWSIFDVANYDVSERRIKIIHKIIQDNIVREAFCGDDTEDFDIDNQVEAESPPDLRQLPSSNINVLSTDEEDETDGTKLTNQISTQHTTLLSTTTTIMAEISLIPPQCVPPDVFSVIDSHDSSKENIVMLQASDACQTQKTASNSSTISQAPSAAPVSTSAMMKKKRQRRVYIPKETPYATRQRAAATVKATK